jgi:FtsP/CotA-like multicopper oxidase with cupredoxin domain
MTAFLTVGEPGAAAEHEGHGEAADYAAMDAAMMDSILEFPAETEGMGNQLLEPAILADGTKQFEITAAITPWEIEPGVVVDAWTYNGQAPGPAIRVDHGDRVSVIVHNELPMGTDVHFHGIKLENAMDGVAPLTQPLIEPGETFTYEFTAEGPAVAMYHAHHHAQVQVPNGLFGTLIIGDLPLPSGNIGGHEVPPNLAVTTELPMVLNDAGVIGFSLNGKSFPATAPLAVKQDDWFVVHYYNEGLQIHPMHLHGFPQLVYAKDGFPLDLPYWVDTLNVAPGERYSVLVHASEAGAWVWHCHILNHVEAEDGMFGMVTAVIVEG